MNSGRAGLFSIWTMTAPGSLSRSLDSAQMDPPGVGWGVGPAQEARAAAMNPRHRIWVGRRTSLLGLTDGRSEGMPTIRLIAACRAGNFLFLPRSEEHTFELQSHH